MPSDQRSRDVRHDQAREENERLQRRVLYLENVVSEVRRANKEVQEDLPALRSDVESVLEENERLRGLARGVIDRAEEPDQCLICGELLDKPENDLGDGEYLGHTLECPIAHLDEALTPEADPLQGESDV